MVGRRHNDQQDESGVYEAQQHEEELAELGHALLTGSKAASEEAGVVDEHGSDTERVSKVQRRERRELVEEFVAGVDGLGILTSDRVEEAVLFGEEARGHAWVRGEGDEAQQVGEGHHATSGGELRVSRCGIVVPCKEAKTRARLDGFILVLGKILEDWDRDKVGGPSFGKTENLPDSDGDMDHRIRAIENRQHSLMIRPEEHLHIHLSQRKQEPKRALVLKPQHSNAMALSRLPHTIRRREQLAHGLDADVEDEVQRPVPHLDEERKLLQEPTVPVPCVPGRVGSVYYGAAAVSLLGRVRRAD